MRVAVLMVCAVMLTGASTYAQGISPGGVGTNGAAIRSLRRQPPSAPPTTQPSAPSTVVPVDKTDDPDEAMNSACAPFLWSDKGKVWPVDDKSTPTFTELQACVVQAKSDLKQQETPATPEAQLALVRLHVQYKTFKRWADAARKQAPLSTRAIVLRSEVAALGTAIHDRLSKAGLREPLSAMLFTGATFGDAAKTAKKGTSSSATDDAKAASAPGPSAMIVFESPHFGEDRPFPLHVAFGGKVGFQQTMSMVKPEPGDKTAADAAPVADYKDSILWSTGMSVYGRTGGKAEGYARASIGGTRVGDSRSVLEADNNRGFLAVPVDAGSQVSAARWEVGLGWNYYGRPMELTHLDKSLLNPAFSVYGLWRKDRRFLQAGDLADFENPEARWAYGMSVNLRNLVTSDGDSVESLGGGTFDFGFTVEREFARGTGLRIPDSTRYMIRGSVNILNALSGAKKPATKQATDTADTSSTATSKEPAAK